jgi:hypothetical protein
MFSGCSLRVRTEKEKKGSVRKSEMKNCSVETAIVMILLKF